MKKVLSVLLMLSMTLSCMGAAFAETSVSDITGTPYEKAVTSLMDRGILSGYPDGTFKAENAITRAEVCSILVNAISPSKSDLEAAQADRFTDVSATNWAASYISYAAEKNMVNGYEDGTFRPELNITYYEMAAMLINAMGIPQSELTGQWPDNYADKAKELGIFDNVVVEDGTAFDGNAPATRGNVAIMTNAVVDEIIKANQTGTPEQDPSEGEDPDQNDPVGTVSQGKLADYSGRAYGIIVDVADVLNTDGDTVQQLTFLFGDSMEYLITKEKNTFNGSFIDNGSLNCLKMRDGVVTEVAAPSNTVNKYYQEFTTESTGVADITNRVVTFADGRTYTISSDASVYVVSNDDYNYEIGSLRDIKKGCEVRLYGITEDSSPNGPVEVVVITKLAS